MTFTEAELESMTVAPWERANGPSSTAASTTRVR